MPGLSFERVCNRDYERKRLEVAGGGAMPYYKVTKENMESVGLLGARPIKYKLGQWVYPGEKLSCHPRKGGGLWVVKERSSAFGIQKYLMKRHKMKTKAFACQIGLILYETNYRVKTNKMKLIEEVFPKTRR